MQIENLANNTDNLNSDNLSDYQRLQSLSQVTGRHTGLVSYVVPFDGNI